MRSPVLLFCLCMLQPASAQFWGIPEARWVYHYSWPWSQGYTREHVYVGDSLFQGYVAQHMVINTTGDWWWPTPEHEFTRIEDDVVYAWGVMGQPWDTLYWFGAEQGDRWWPIGHPQSCPPMGMMEVIMTGDTILDGLTLATWKIGVVGPDSVVYSGWTMMLIERLGMLPRHGAYDDCASIFENPFFNWVCYSDMDSQIPPGSDCFLTTRIGSTRTSYANLHPNPGTDQFTITGLSPGTTIRVCDPLGRLIHSDVSTTSAAIIPTSAWEVGTYYITVSHGSGGPSRSLRWVKT